MLEVGFIIPAPCCDPPLVVSLPTLAEWDVAETAGVTELALVPIP